MYYNPINETISPQNIRSNTQRTPSTGIENFKNSETNNRFSETFIDHQLESSHENNSPGSSSDESYLVPCTKYIDFDLQKLSDNRDVNMSNDEPEIPNVESSISSNNSETNTKSIQRYESLKASDITEHCYTNYNDIGV